MGRYLDIIRGREMALHKQCADLDGQGSAEIQESESRHERNEKDEETSSGVAVNSSDSFTSFADEIRSEFEVKP